MSISDAPVNDEAAKIITSLRMALSHYTKQRWSRTSIAGGHGEPRIEVWYLECDAGHTHPYTALGDNEPWQWAESDECWGRGVNANADELGL